MEDVWLIGVKYTVINPRVIFADVCSVVDHDTPQYQQVLTMTRRCYCSLMQQSLIPNLYSLEAFIQN